MTRVLVAEDDPDLALGLKNNLEIEGYDVRVARDGAEALACALQWQPALLVLDLVMPKMDGMRVLRELREHDTRIAVLILTARGEEADKVRGLKLGADDYVTKPFGLLELLARVESLLRRARTAPLNRSQRCSASATSRSSRAHGACARPGRSRATAQGIRPADRPAASSRRGALAAGADAAVWGYSSAVITRTVDTHMFELRRKLEADATHPRHIMTVRSIGYRLDDRES